MHPMSVRTPGRMTGLGATGVSYHRIPMGVKRNTFDDGVTGVRSTSGVRAPVSFVRLVT